MIDFDSSRWARIKKDYTAWWQGKLDRPLVSISMNNREPDRPKPKQPDRDFAAFYDLSVPAEEIIDCWDYSLARRKFIGDAFPSVWPNFGAGVIAAFMGATLQNGENTVWFHPKEQKEISDLHFPKTVDENNVWFRRVRDICKAAHEKWHGQVQVGMTDLGGNLDILSAFRPSERLLLDLYDHPEEVKRLSWEAHNAWWAYFDAINKVLQPVNPGYTAWTSIYSPEPYYMLQCDFCYMIGPQMFDEFVKPELSASCKRLKNAFYHLDGPGQLPHLDSLLSIPELKGVQWVPGSGRKDYEEWPEVFRKIQSAGKLLQLFNGSGKPEWQSIERVVHKLGTAKGIIMIGWAEKEDEPEILRMLDSLGVPY